VADRRGVETIEARDIAAGEEAGDEACHAIMERGEPNADRGRRRDRGCPGRATTRAGPGRDRSHRLSNSPQPGPDRPRRVGRGRRPGRSTPTRDRASRRPSLARRSGNPNLRALGLTRARHLSPGGRTWQFVSVSTVSVASVASR
jgi:hypothetical protein